MHASIHTYPSEAFVGLGVCLHMALQCLYCALCVCQLACDACDGVRVCSGLAVSNLIGCLKLCSVLRSLRPCTARMQRMHTWLCMALCACSCRAIACWKVFSMVTFYT